MRILSHRPNAPAIVASLRAIGYSLGAALADIVDNSITAGAKFIDIGFEAQPTMFVGVLDDGIGMSSATLLEAMRHGGLGPDAPRASDDLGRFGLGLKTASLSQCRQLTVLSKFDGVISGARWDLEIVEREGDWSLQILDPDDMPTIPRYKEIAAMPHGTLVVWQVFDRLSEDVSSGFVTLESEIDKSREHLALTFHRFISPFSGESGCSLSINRNPLESFDPFLRSDPRTEELPVEHVRIGESVVVIRPFVLPKPSKLSREQIRSAAAGEDLFRTQGFYVYRNRRLITHGTWYRLIRQDELTRLARVCIDTPNSIDELWGIDVRKSRATPPPTVRAVLQRIIKRIADRGESVFREPRQRSGPAKTTSLWLRTETFDATLYSVNRDHSLCAVLSQGLSHESLAHLDNLIHALEMSLPLQSIFNDYARDKVLVRDDVTLKSDLIRLALSLLSSPGVETSSRASILEVLPSMEPFSNYPTLTKSIMEALANEYR